VCNGERHRGANQATDINAAWQPGYAAESASQAAANSDNAGESTSNAGDSAAESGIHNTFIGLLVGTSTDIEADLERIGQAWQPSFVPMALETIRFSRQRVVSDALVALLEKNTGQKHGIDIDAWFRWLWSMPEDRHPRYASFKSNLYQYIAPIFGEYFADDRATTVRLDEARWGGVPQDGIPPLRQPEMIDADEADYLADSDVVFGIKLNGDARAYPKRILAWHEMFVDTIGGTEYAGVYCTLCGAVILYSTHFDGVRHELGTSGFLYRSNKMMYDKATQSLWSLVGKGIALERSYLVTTTWGEWRRRHPATTVLSLATGHQRNYDEGIAYQAYFATDELMFTVPKRDDRLANKAEILALQFPALTEQRLAIAADYLAKRPVFHHALGDQTFVVLTDTSGANRVYATAGQSFENYDGNTTVTDADGALWTLSEAKLTSLNGETLMRLPAHRAFWFGWYAVHNDTELIYDALSCQLFGKSAAQ